MRISRRSWPGIALVAAPASVALFGLNLPSAIILTGALLAWKWAITLSELMAEPAGPRLRLESIAVSHFVEKVRWCLDRLGADYEEVPDVGVLGAFTVGRTVPRLCIRTGRVTSVIGDSPEILRYLWGRFAVEMGQAAEFLRPSAEALALETRLDRYGVDLQRWVYYHILPHREITLHAWGATDPRLPVWQKHAVSLGYPVLRMLMRRAFRLSDAAHATVVGNIESLLADMDACLADDRPSLLGGASTDFADITFAAFTGLWLQPPAYAAGRAEFEKMSPDELPAAMVEDIRRWQLAYPHVTGFVERLYRDERLR
jgi:glutathione S-transferase